MTSKHVPPGRVNEFTAKLTVEQRQRTAVKYGRGIGDDATIQTWPNRVQMARQIRRDQINAPHSEWNPLVKLTDGEGY